MAGAAGIIAVVFSPAKARERLVVGPHDQERSRAPAEGVPGILGKDPFALPLYVEDRRRGSGAHGCGRLSIGIDHDGVRNLKLRSEFINLYAGVSPRCDPDHLSVSWEAPRNIVELCLCIAAMGASGGKVDEKGRALDEGFEGSREGDLNGLWKAGKDITGICSRGSLGPR